MDRLALEFIRKLPSFHLTPPIVIITYRMCPSYRGKPSMRYAQTMAFTTLVLASLFNVLNARSDEQSAFLGLFSNKWLVASIALSVLLQIAVVYVPFLQLAFSTVSLNIEDWI